MANIEEIKQKIIEWLVQFGISKNHIITPTEQDISKAPEQIRPILNRTIVVPYTLKATEQGMPDLVLKSQIIFDEKWIQVKLLLLSGKEIPDNLRIVLYEKLLLANFELNEVTYSLSQGKDVYVEADMPVDSTLENFKSEYGSIEFGVDYFLHNIIPGLKSAAKIPAYNPNQRDQPDFFI
ncbi:MAG: hypothetical protein ACFFCS_28525 [Candidatus Hodarchaeota archaeon]